MNWIYDKVGKWAGGKMSGYKSYFGLAQMALVIVIQVIFKLFPDIDLSAIQTGFEIPEVSWVIILGEIGIWWKMVGSVDKADKAIKAVKENTEAVNAASTANVIATGEVANAVNQPATGGPGQTGPQTDPEPIGFTRSIPR
jgi:hypothetical protein